MPFDPTLAAIRFGTGLSPRVAPPQGIAEIMERLRGPDQAAREWPIAAYGSILPQVTDYFTTQFASNHGTAAERAAADERLEGMRQQKRAATKADFRATLARMATSSDGLRERLALFWADHFTVVGKNNDNDWAPYVSSYVEDAIRPHVAGRFRDMLVAVTTHPMMLHYLDQDRSMGPESVAGRERGKGLNENLARELLELHTLGVGGPYGQDDVRELAKLLTGLTLDRGAMAFRPRWVEPGPKTVLGRVYPESEGLESVEAVLGDLAGHPITAEHIARKLAVHFVADEPDADLVSALRTAFLDTGGDLAAVTEALVSHPAAWTPERRKVRQPVEFLAASLRALGVSGAWIAGRARKETDDLFLEPMAEMGQPWQQAGGPNGWPEEAEAWVTPQGVAARINWAMTRPERLVAELPDPRVFVETALGPNVSEAVATAAHAAERPDEGIGLVLASAEFQRR
ncbi:MAG TPA: DUF1800 domain-containing protein [Rubellimicrobium sp.]|nr:DUF1800 domain-containing protein [Rubellimicrobium sp.]